MSNFMSVVAFRVFSRTNVDILFVVTTTAFAETLSFSFFVVLLTLTLVAHCVNVDWCCRGVAAIIYMFDAVACCLMFATFIQDCLDGDVSFLS